MSSPINKGVRPGVLYIFNHRKFDDKLKLPERVGTEHDVHSLQEVFGQYKVISILFNDKTVEQIRKILTIISKEDYSLNSSIIFAILSHGDENNMMAARDGYYNFNEILPKLATNITLRSKAKICLLQACRGKINVHKLRGRPKFKWHSDGEPTNTTEDDDYYCDELYILQSTTETMKAFRLAEHGSFFIQTFYKCLQKFGKDKNVKEIHDQVMKEVQRKTKSCQMPAIYTNAIKTYIFGKYCMNYKIPYCGSDPDTNTNGRRWHPFKFPFLSPLR